MAVGSNVLALALAMALPLAGCAAIRASGARQTERLLTEAGFRAESAGSPARLADLDAAPPLKLVARSRDGALVYTYSDPYHCRCLYVGGPAEHSAYRRLAMQRERARAEREAAWYWEVWGPWWWR
jgi:hypothetical protein